MRALARGGEERARGRGAVAAVERVPPRDDVRRVIQRVERAREARDAEERPRPHSGEPVRESSACGGGITRLFLRHGPHPKLLQFEQGDLKRSPWLESLCSTLQAHVFQALSGLTSP